MEIKKFSELTQEQLSCLIDAHFNHWVKFNPKMEKANTEYKFKELYCKDNLPFGVALFDNNEIVGFCVFKIENLVKYPQFYPWLSDVMILPPFRGKGYGKKLLEYGQKILKELKYNRIYVWTDQAPDFYKKLGFNYLQQVEKNEGGFGELFYKDI
ncbi:MAG: GNAT family N-acetyltransferase [Clostridia bacterium]|nr:GNAT family N-acetyltransferase [Clostridia bacterium]